MMLYLVDLIRGEKTDRFVAQRPTEIIPFLEKEDPASESDFLVRIQKVEQSRPAYVRESLEAAT